MEVPLKLTVVYYHERQSVLIDPDNMIKPIQDARAACGRFLTVAVLQRTEATEPRTSVSGVLALLPQAANGLPQPRAGFVPRER